MLQWLIHSLDVKPVSEIQQGCLRTLLRPLRWQSGEVVRILFERPASSTGKREVEARGSNGHLHAKCTASEPSLAMGGAKDRRIASSTMTAGPLSGTSALNFDPHVAWRNQSPRPKAMPMLQHWAKLASRSCFSAFVSAVTTCFLAR